MKTRLAEPSAATTFRLHTTLPLPSKVGQIDGLQVLRFIAVSIVAWGHAGLPLRSVGVSTPPNLGIFGIDIFFVISGFIMSSIVLHTRAKPGPRTAWKFLQRRLIRIYPVYWIFAGLGAFRLYHNHQLFKQNFIPAFFLVPLPQFPRIYDLSWTLMFEMFFYAVLGILLLATVRRAIPVVIAAFSIAACMGAVAGIQRPVWIMLGNPILLEFVFGAAIALAFVRIGRRPKLGIALLSFGWLAAFYLQAHPPSAADSMQMILAGQNILARTVTWGLSAALIVAGTVLWSPPVNSRVGIVAVVLGNASYSAYLASPLVEEFSLRAVMKLHPTLPLSLGTEMAIQTALLLVILAAGWLSYQFMEWPLVRTLQKWSASLQKERSV